MYILPPPSVPKYVGNITFMTSSKVCHMSDTPCILEVPCSLVIHLTSNIFAGMQHAWEKSAYIVSVEKLKRKRTLRRSDVGGKIILKRILGK
jgi:hypothetical protein